MCEGEGQRGTDGHQETPDKESGTKILERKITESRAEMMTGGTRM